MAEDEVSLSRFLSYVLRHRPDSIGLRLDGAGWVDIGDLIACSAATGRSFTPAELHAVVANSDKQRFQVVDGRIRAAQGHSVEVDLGLAAATPPDVLYHGTVERFVPAILEQGLLPGRRQHVHLSADIATATQVGARRGEPVIFAIDADGMHRAGIEFQKSANGVWLTDRVAPGWLVRHG